MRILFYDTETSDMPLWAQPSAAPEQPHVVQLAAALVETEGRRVISEIDLLVRPRGWACTPETIAIHGITNERAVDEGVDEALAINMFYELWSLSDLRVGHVESFDARMIRIALMRHGFGEEDADAWKAAPAACTAELSRTTMGLKGRKNPSLVDAYRHFTGNELQNAHTARADMRATMELYWLVTETQGADLAPAAPPSDAPPAPTGWHMARAHVQHRSGKYSGRCGCVAPSSEAAVACACGATYDGVLLLSSTADFFCYDCRRKVSHG